MSTTPLNLPKKLIIAYLYCERNTYLMIADKTSTSKSTVHRTIQLLNSEEVNEEVYDFKKQLRYHLVLFHSLQNPFITNKKIS